MAEDYDFRLIGAPRTPLRDFYHALMRLSWPTTLTCIVVVYLFLNALFAAAYLGVGGVASARTGSFADAFFFSVQTMGTIGYGALSPTTPAANVLVVVESVISLLFTALIVRHLIAGRAPDCACFGAWSSKPVGRGHLVRNTILLAIAVLALWA